MSGHHAPGNAQALEERKRLKQHEIEHTHNYQTNQPSFHTPTHHIHNAHPITATETTQPKPLSLHDLAATKPNDFKGRSVPKSSLPHTHHYHSNSRPTDQPTRHGALSPGKSIHF